MHSMKKVPRTDISDLIYNIIFLADAGKTQPQNILTGDVISWTFHGKSCSLSFQACL